jgi:steroid 5-alpha reductase family enzyme
MTTYVYGLLAMLMLGVVTWLLSVVRKDVSIVDSIWSLMFLAGAAVYASAAPDYGVRTQVILGLLLLWALRLAAYLTWRNWGEPEDRRYQDIRAKYQPHFAIKSLVIIFAFQAVLAWIISLPLWPALTSSNAFTIWDLLAVMLWAIGMFFETVADWQLARFKANPANKGKVMDRGLWRYTRHPNYFGECLVWWGFFLFALGSGAWWTVISPLLMTWLLLKFSGVVMLEQTITERRPAYRDYIARTNAFIPGKPRHVAATAKMEGHTS